MKLIENSNVVCFRCLRHAKVEVFRIPEIGNGSYFDGFSSEIHLCRHCIDDEIRKWLELEVIGNQTKKRYVYEQEILDFVNGLPVAGQELFYNRFAYGINVPYVPARQWIEEREKETGLKHDESKEYTGESYSSRFNECEEVYNVVMPDGTVFSKCPFGECGKEGGKTSLSDEKVECYKCSHFKTRTAPIRNIPLSNEEEYRNLRLKELMTIMSKLRRDKDYDQHPLVAAQVNDVEPIYVGGGKE